MSLKEIMLNNVNETVFISGTLIAQACHGTTVEVIEQQPILSQMFAGAICMLTCLNLLNRGQGSNINMSMVWSGGGRKEACTFDSNKKLYLCNTITKWSTA